MSKREDIVAQALRAYADVMISNPDSFTTEQGKALDRALRSCRGISDIDVVWVRWSFVGDKKGWITDSEMTYSPKKGYHYP